jgi:hypothetical protein
MPRYDFKNSVTNEIETHTMSWLDLEQFKKNNPNLERYHSAENLPRFGDGIRMSTPGTGQPDSTFEKYVIGRMAETIPGNTIKANHKTKKPREF